MNKQKIILITAICGLILIFLATIFYARDQISFRNFKILLLAGTLIWFIGILVVNRMIRRKIDKNYFLNLIIVFLILAGCTNQGNKTEQTSWPVEKAWVWSEEIGWLRGCNYIPNTAVNQLEMWQEETFDTVTIDRELGWAEELGFNVMRVYMHSFAWKQDPEGLRNGLKNTLLHQINMGYIPYLFFSMIAGMKIQNPGHSLNLKLVFITPAGYRIKLRSQDRYLS